MTKGASNDTPFTSLLNREFANQLIVKTAEQKTRN